MLRFKSFAKINLGLQVLYLRNDNYHEINSLFLKICLADEIIIEPSKELIVHCNPELNIVQENNIAYKTAKLIQKSFECKSKGAKITIHKNIPLGGGLGGGSSNSAIVMMALNDFWDIKASVSQLQTLSLNLGSDVPFFFGDTSAIAKGRGEILEYIDFSPSYHLLLIFPGINIDTSWAYGNMNKDTYSAKPIDYKKFFSENQNVPQLWKKFIKNDFEKIVFNKYPILNEIKSVLHECGSVYSSMTGSGSTIYGFFERLAQIEEAKKKLSKYQNFVCIRHQK
jgi:4-diphosphocytidyl-2-C-methyl-D-erythritol kinase